MHKSFSMRLYSITLKAPELSKLSYIVYRYKVSGDLRVKIINTTCAKVVNSFMYR